MHTKLLDPDITRKLLACDQDELTAPMEQRLNAIQGTACPRCGSALHAHINPKHLFSGHLPHLLARCPECEFEMDPESKIVLHTGKANLVTDPLPIIRP